MSIVHISQGHQTKFVPISFKIRKALKLKKNIKLNFNSISQFPPLSCIQQRAHCKKKEKKKTDRNLSSQGTPAKQILRQIGHHSDGP